MRPIVTLILALSMLMQSLPGLTQRCAAMPAGKPANAECACCHMAMAGDRECGLPDSGRAACNCKAQQPDQPKTPPPDPKQQSVEQVLAFVPVLVAVLPFEPPAASPWRHPVDPPLWRSCSSAQSLLCVWLM
jgi:hypothetical protein